MGNENVNLICVLLNDGIFFRVQMDIDGKKTIDLKEIIVKAKPNAIKCEAYELVLYFANNENEKFIQLSNPKMEEYIEHLNLNGNDSMQDDALLTTYIHDTSAHILIQLPEMDKEGYKSDNTDHLFKKFQKDTTFEGLIGKEEITKTILERWVKKKLGKNSNLVDWNDFGGKHPNTIAMFLSQIIQKAILELYIKNNELNVTLEIKSWLDSTDDDKFQLLDDKVIETSRIKELINNAFDKYGNELHEDHFKMLVFLFLKNSTCIKQNTVETEKLFPRINYRYNPFYTPNGRADIYYEDNNQMTYIVELKLLSTCDLKNAEWDNSNEAKDRKLNPNSQRISQFNFETVEDIKNAAVLQARSYESNAVYRIGMLWEPGRIHVMPDGFSDCSRDKSIRGKRLYFERRPSYGLVRLPEHLNEIIKDIKDGVYGENKKGELKKICEMCTVNDDQMILPSEEEENEGTMGALTTRLTKTKIHTSAQNRL